MSTIKEQMGITQGQFDKLKKAIISEMIDPKPKQYWTKPCAHCDGNGRVVEKTDGFRVFERLQDEDLGCVKEYASLEQAERYLSERRGYALGTSAHRQCS